MTVTVIAEIGVNHNGDMDLARRLIDGAAEAGAQYAKFQSFKAADLVTRTAPKAAISCGPPARLKASSTCCVATSSAKTSTTY